MSDVRNLLSFVVPARAIAEMLMVYASIDREWTGAQPKPFPPDARYVRAYYDQELDTFVLIFEHETFPRTPEGSHIVRARAVVQAPVVGYLESEG